MPILITGRGSSLSGSPIETVDPLLRRYVEATSEAEAERELSALDPERTPILDFANYAATPLNPDHPAS
jgi:hypothetical protein